MPIYVYQHPDREEYVEVVQGMNDDHVYIDSHGISWNRVFLPPNTAIDLETDPFSNQQFIEKTANAGSMGELWDRSAEMSHKRAEKTGGTDPYREKYFKNYAKERGGNKHLDDH